ncbi:MAG: acyltransferase domain-containing protein, partial [Cyanobacteria bacterium J06558_2]
PPFLRGAGGDRSSLLNQTQYTQPALFTIEYALAQLWISWGIQPDGVMGHSIGEYVAATIAGVFSLEDALKLVAARGRLMQQLPPNGSMVSILGDLELVNKLIEPFQKQVCIAAINGNQSIVISGENEALDIIINQLEEQEIKYKQLKVSHGFHSLLMQPILEDFYLAASAITYHQPQLDLVANVTGNFITSEMATAEYWCQQIVNPVLFANSMATLDQAGYGVFIECGSKPILLGMGRFFLEEYPPTLPHSLLNKGGKRGSYLWVSSLKEGESDRQTILNSLASLYCHGFEIDWLSFYSSGDYQKVILPTYPFQKKSYWIEVKPVNITKQKSLNLLVGQKLNIARSNNIIWETIFEGSNFLLDHQVFNTSIMPAAGFIEMVLSVGQEVFSTSSLAIENLSIQQPLVITESATVVQLIINPEANYSWELVSLSEDNNWITHATGNIKEQSEIVEQASNLLVELQRRCNQEIDVDLYYQELGAQGLNYGSSFQAIAQLWQGENIALAKIKLPLELLPVTDSYQLHPVILDACFQAIAAAFPEEEIYLPVELDQLLLSNPIDDYAQVYWGYVELKV